MGPSEQFLSFWGAQVGGLKLCPNKSIDILAGRISLLLPVGHHPSASFCILPAFWVASLGYKNEQRLLHLTQAQTGKGQAFCKR